MNASIKKILHSECNCNVGFVLFNILLLLLFFPQINVNKRPKYFPEYVTSRILPENFTFFNREF